MGVSEATDLGVPGVPYLHTKPIMPCFEEEVRDLSRRTRPGKRVQKTMENHHAING